MEQALRYTKYLDGQSQGQRNKKEQKLQASSLMKREKVTWRTREIREKLAESMTEWKCAGQWAEN